MKMKNLKMKKMKKNLMLSVVVLFMFSLVSCKKEADPILGNQLEKKVANDSSKTSNLMLSNFITTYINAVPHFDYYDVSSDSFVDYRIMDWSQNGVTGNLYGKSIMGLNLGQGKFSIYTSGNSMVANMAYNTPIGSNLTTSAWTQSDVDVNIYSSLEGNNIATFNSNFPYNPNVTYYMGLGCLRNGKRYYGWLSFSYLPNFPPYNIIVKTVKFRTVPNTSINAGI